MRILSLVLLLSTASTPVLAQQAAPSAAALHLRMLTWPGKVAAAAPQPQARRFEPGAAPAPQRIAPRAIEAAAPEIVGPTQVASAAFAAAPAPAPAPMLRFSSYRPVPHIKSHMLGDVTPQQEAQIDALRARTQAEAETVKAKAQLMAEAEAAAEKKGDAARPPAPLPTSIYAPATPQAAAPAARVAANSPFDQKARFYSVHRQYGQAPDPVTLSPQFLAAPSPDLADPPPPPAPRLQPNATAGQQTAARVQARDSADTPG